MIPTFAGNTVGGSMWTLDYIKVRSGCSCEIMPKLKKKKKYKKSKPRDQDLDPETWDFHRIRTDSSTSEYAISLLKKIIFYRPIDFESMKNLIKKKKRNIYSFLGSIKMLPIERIIFLAKVEMLILLLKVLKNLYCF